MCYSINTFIQQWWKYSDTLKSNFIELTWRECISFSSSYALLSSSNSSSSWPGRRNGEPHWREFLSGSMLITEKATPCSSSPTWAARGNRVPTTRSWSASRSVGTRRRRSVPERRGRPRAQVRIPPPWRRRGTSPVWRPVIKLFTGSEESPSWEQPSSSSLPDLLLLLPPTPRGKLWWRSAFRGQRWLYWHSDRHFNYPH